MTFYKATGEDNKIDQIWFYIPEFFDGITTINEDKIYQELNKTNIENVYVVVDFDNEEAYKNVFNISYLLKHIFLEYTNLEYIKIFNVSKFDIEELFKSLLELAEEFLTKGTVFCQKLGYLEIDSLSSVNKDSARFYIENLFGSGIFCHINQILLQSNQGLLNDFYDDDSNLEKLIKYKENLKNIEGFKEFFEISNEEEAQN